MSSAKISNFPVILQQTHVEILNMLQKNPIIRNSQCVEFFGIGRTTMFEYLTDLQIIGLVKPKQVNDCHKRGRPPTEWKINSALYADMQKSGKIVIKAASTFRLYKKHLRILSGIPMEVFCHLP